MIALDELTKCFEDPEITRLLGALVDQRRHEELSKQERHILKSLCHGWPAITIRGRKVEIRS